MTSKIITFLIFCMGCSGITIGQINQKKKEFEIKKIANQIEALPVGKEGILVFKDSKSSNNWEFTLYDSNLEQIWQFETDISKKYTITGNYFDRQTNTGYLLFQKGSKSILAMVNPVNNLFQKKLIKLANEFILEVNGLKVTENVAYMTGKVKNDSHIVCFDFISNTLTLLVKEEKSRLEAIEVRPSTNIVDVTTFTRNMKEGFFTIYSFEKGKLINKIQTLPDDEKRWMAGRISNTEKGQLIVATYGIYDYPDGLCVSGYEQGKKTFSKYYNFAEMKTFHDHIWIKVGFLGNSDKKRETLKEKQLEGKNTDLDYKIYLHPIIIRTNDIIVLCEVSQPFYQRFYSGTGSNRTSSTELVGWQVAQTFITCFDKEGNLLWEDYFNAEGVFEDRGKHVQTKTEGDKVKMFMGFSTTLNAKIVTGDKIREEEKKTGMIKEDEKDEVRANLYTFIYDFPTFNSSYWYDNYFIGWGKQIIKNRSHKDNRTIFFVNKISF